jgi:cytochrome P450
MRLKDINLLDRDFFAKGVPHASFTFLRQNYPIYRHPEPSGPGFWVLSKYEDVRAISRDPATYSSSRFRLWKISKRQPKGCQRPRC